MLTLVSSVTRREVHVHISAGGTVGLLALNALFTLIKDYNLGVATCRLQHLFDLSSSEITLRSIPDFTLSLIETCFISNTAQGSSD